MELVLAMPARSELWREWCHRYALSSQRSRTPAGPGEQRPRPCVQQLLCREEPEPHSGATCPLLPLNPAATLLSCTHLSFRAEGSDQQDFNQKQASVPQHEKLIVSQTMAQPHRCQVRLWDPLPASKAHPSAPACPGIAQSSSPWSRSVRQGSTGRRAELRARTRLLVQTHASNHCTARSTPGVFTSHKHPKCPPARARGHGKAPCSRSPERVLVRSPSEQRACCPPQLAAAELKVQEPPTTKPQAGFYEVLARGRRFWVGS